MARPEKIRLGDLLVQQRLISQEQLKDALDKQKLSGRKLGRVLAELGFVTEDEICSAIAQQLRIPVVDLKQAHPRPEVVRLLPEPVARRFRVVALEARENAVLVAMADPTDLFAYDELRNLIGREIQLAVASESALAQFIDRVYRRTEEITELARSLTEELSEDVIDFNALTASGSAEEAPVMRLLQTIFEDAMQVKASDIHVEPMERQLRIRFRVDGVLNVASEADRKVGPALVQRLKLMADLDIAEKRMPQDGRFMIRLKQRALDVRMSTIPTQFGESAVLRLLTHGDTVSLADLGLPPDKLARLTRLIGRPHGLVLVTGPTGAGKTTTLYAALNALNTPERKILTVEDPVEYRLPGISQVQVNDKIELDFARALRAFLRQDPDVILLGEMRDSETAQIALRAALTGHMVLSTLHTNDAPSAAARLLDMGAPGFLLASSLSGVVAQRLVRKLCPVCAAPANPDANEAEWLAQAGGDRVAPENARRAVGCGHCNHSGYLGRAGIYEILEIDLELANQLNNADSVAFRALAEQRLHGQTLRDEVLRMVNGGVTSIAEAMRVTHQIDD